MPIDPKIPARLPTVTTSRTSVAPAQPQVTNTTPSTPTPTRPLGYQSGSSFGPTPTNYRTSRTGGQDDTVGREGAFADTMGRGSQDDTVGRGSQDDTVGRTKGKGGQDDTVGRGSQDDTVGRTKGKGGQDDTVGRTSGKGGQDDTVGNKKKSTGAQDDTVGDIYAARAALVGRSDTPNSRALRDAINTRLETPSFLKGAETVATQVFNFAKKALPLSATQVGQLTTALKGAKPETASLLGALIEKCPEALTNADSKGQTLLANLAKLASQPMNPAISGDTTKPELMTSVLRDIVNPNRIDQGDAPTCTVTSMQYELVADEPAEYLRLLTDLTGPQGRAKMRGGSELILQNGDAGTREGRSVSQTVFQTVAMEFGNGRTLDFNPSAGGSIDDAGKMVQRGLKPEQQTQVLRQLFGVNYRSEMFQTEAEGAKVLEKLRNFSSKDAQNRPIILHIDQGSFNHAVTYEKVADQRVYFRDPYGELRSMPENQFKTFVVGIEAPKDLDIVR